MRQMRQLWERFVSGCEVDLHHLPPIIREAWIRSRNAGIDPALPYAPLEEIPKDLASPPQKLNWRPCAESVFSLLCGFFTESHQFLYLVDDRGRLLAIRGGRKAMARAEAIRAIPGGDWSEEKVGCCAVGTCLHTGAPVQVAWEENYILTLKDWASMAAPIHHPVTEEVLGAIGAAGHGKSSHPREFELLVRSAELIEGKIREQIATDRISVLEQFALYASRYPADCLLALDREGKIATLNSAAEKLFSLPATRVIGYPIQNIPGFRERVGELKTVDTVDLPRLLQSIPGVRSFPIATGQSKGMILLISPSATSVRAKKELDQPWSTTYTFADLAGENKGFRDCVNRAQVASQHDWPVLLLGESGTGKEMFAQSIHAASYRHNKPFVPLDCSSLSDDLVGMELFGYEEGAFTGAAKGGKIGKIQLAHQGTLFLDDVDNLPQKVQMSLLRVLETGRVVPIGGSKPRLVDVRLVSASNTDLDTLVHHRQFRQDLYHRLKVITIQLPPLRERLDDIKLLAPQLLFHEGLHGNISEDALDVLREYEWPGNVRELRNVLLEASTLASHQHIDTGDLPASIIKGRSARSIALQSSRHMLGSVETELITRILQQSKNVSEAASRLGLHHATLYRKIKRYGITLPGQHRN
jgi:sigma-54 dependent transcriptional regulator, acetoin dehydrogenase operon transcriptional activator AcoR